MPPSPSSSLASISDAAEAQEPIIRVRGLVTRLGGKILHQNINLDVWPGEVLGVVGASGAGKSVLLRTIIGLIHPAEGTIEVFGEEISQAEDSERAKVAGRWGVLFQDGALFSSLTVAENIQVPLKERLDLSRHLLDEIAAVKISLVGLPLDSARKYPSELSGGMRKRAGLARALALDPRLLFLDEPTAGLDPISATDFDMLVRDLQQSLGLTVLMVTHDLDTLVATCDRIAVLVDKTLRIGTIPELLEDPHPWIQAYFRGKRGRAALAPQESHLASATSSNNG
jgi:phospholipid/cholesterol/gamma-HCH transport system ATP-binding protein